MYVSYLSSSESELLLLSSSLELVPPTEISMLSMFTGDDSSLSGDKGLCRRGGGGEGGGREEGGRWETEGMREEERE